MSKKYTLWEVDHVSVYDVDLIKIKDTNSTAEMEKWMNESMHNAASFCRSDVREGQSISANYVQTFSE